MARRDITSARTAQCDYFTRPVELRNLSTRPSDNADEVLYGSPLCRNLDEGKAVAGEAVALHSLETLPLICRNRRICMKRQKPYHEC